MRSNEQRQSGRLVEPVCAAPVKDGHAAPGCPCQPAYDVITRRAPRQWEMTASLCHLPSALAPRPSQEFPQQISEMRILPSRRANVHGDENRGLAEKRFWRGMALLRRPARAKSTFDHQESSFCRRFEAFLGL